MTIFPVVEALFSRALQSVFLAAAKDAPTADTPKNANSLINSAESAVTAAVSEAKEGLQSAGGETIDATSKTIQSGAGWFTKTFDQTVFGVYAWQVLAILLTVLVTFLIVRVAFAIAAREKGFLTRRFGAQWTSRVVRQLSMPISLLAMAGTLSLITLFLDLPPKGLGIFIPFIVKVLAVLPCVWGLYRCADLFCDRLAINAAAGKTRIDKDAVPLVRRTVQALVIMLGIVFVLQNMGVDVGSLLAGLGIGGIAIAMAAKDTLSNFFGSLVLIGDRPFKIGDKICVNGIEGDVESIGLRSTRVRTYFDSLVAVPNSKLADSTIDNQGVRKYRRTSTVLGISYDSTPEQIEAFVEGIRAIIRANEYTRKDNYEVSFTGFGAYSLEILLYYFVQNISWRVELKAKQDINMEIMRLAKALKIEFAFPTQTLQHQFVAEPGAPRSIAEPLSDEEMRQIIRGFAPGGRLSTPSTPVIDGEWTVGFEPEKPASEGGESNAANAANAVESRAEAPSQKQ